MTQPTVKQRDPSAEIRRPRLTPRFVSSTFVKQGHLRTTPFHTLLQVALKSHAYGRLDLQEGRARRQIMFMHGLPVSVRSNLPGESLLGFMRAQDLISAAAYDDASRHGTTRDQKDHLLEQHQVSPEQLRIAELDLADLTLLECLTWDAAMFRFNPIPPGAPPKQRLHLNPILVIARWLQQQRQPIRLSESLEADSGGRLVPTPLGIRHLALLDTCRVHIAGFSRALDDWRSIDSLTGFGYDDPVASYVKAAIDLGLLDVRDRFSDADRHAWLHHLVELEHHRVLNARSPEALLEVPDDADNREIHAAYMALERFTHSDNFTDFAELRPMAREVRRLVEGAMRQFIPEQPISRPTSLRSIRSSGIWDPPQTRDPSTQHALAHVLFLDGMTYLKLADLDEAHEHFEQAHQLHPEEARYLAFLGWSLYLRSYNTDDRETGRKAVLEAMHRDPELDLTYVILGNIYVREGQQLRALNLYRKAVTLNPRNKDARKRLRRLEDELG
ncbi:MAG: hypothetical protein CMH57_05605 [Myxococcales bacterium]|nr:hypothetical protein [Myxococcales bacterium]